MKSTLPLLLIDIDGPLNPYGGQPERRPEGYTTHRMCPSGWTHGKPLRVWLNHGHGEELLALAEQYELVWATTWKGEANVWIGPRHACGGTQTRDTDTHKAVGKRGRAAVRLGRR
ncbi:hypothetical protein GCM10020367_11640 [Streptomyces sannanensis]|uniref:Secreted protein n=1 Tax=Streptomyces sannanensis TaxID=285536 RepID=A0ABP6S6E5_9ACTN